MAKVLDIVYLVVAGNRRPACGAPGGVVRPPHHEPKARGGE